MNQPEENAHEGLNPYRSPAEAGLPETVVVPVIYTLPPMHWPRTIGIFIVLAVAGLATYGSTLVFAFPIFFGGIRTALIYRSCGQKALIPPSYVYSTITSPILCFVYQIAAFGAFFCVCATRFTLDRPPMSEQAWLAMTGLISVGVFALLYWSSIKVGVASCRPMR